MTTINRTELLEDVKMYMRSDNIFSDAEMNKIIDKIVTAVGNDDDNYEEVLCKSLKNIALNNKAQATSSGGLKSIKIDNALEESYYQEGNIKSWGSYIDTLPDICSSFGYTGLSQYSTGFMYISPGDTISVNPTSSGSSNTSVLFYPI